MALQANFITFTAVRLVTPSFGTDEVTFRVEIDGRDADGGKAQSVFFSGVEGDQVLPIFDTVRDQLFENDVAVLLFKNNDFTGKFLELGKKVITFSEAGTGIRTKEWNPVNDEIYRLTYEITSVDD